MEYTIQYDEELNMNFEIPDLDMSGWSYEDFVHNHRGLILETILAALMTAVEFSIDHVPVFAVRDTEVVFTLQQKDYQHQLQSCLEHFAAAEEYELCAIAKELAEKLKP